MNGSHRVDRRVRPGAALVVGVLTTALAACSAAGAETTGATTVPEVPSATVPATTPATPRVDETTGPVASSEPPITTVAPPVDAASIANEITAAERGIRDPELSAESVAAFGRRQQRAYQLLARNPDLQEAVTMLLPGDVGTAFAFNVAARRAVVDHAAGAPPSDPPATLPAWTILEPRPIDELLADYREAETMTGVPWEYLAAINFVETRMGRIRGESSAGAVGPMQFLPATWEACCVGDVEDPHDAIVGAATFLADRGAPGDMDRALHGYNPNDGYVGAVTAYASNLIADPLAYRGYHAWEVYVSSTAGTVRLPLGYSESTPVDAHEYTGRHTEVSTDVSE